jgi:large subunit ribosomal protein L15
MNLHELAPAKGSVKKKRRIARGEGSGSGLTAGRGHKGDKARSGFKNKKGFEGGQMPIQRRIPKKGFKNINRVEYAPVNIEMIQHLSEKLKVTEITLDMFTANGICAKTDKVKVLGRGEIKSAITINVNAASQSAIEAIEKAGGKVNIV